DFYLSLTSGRFGLLGRSRLAASDHAAEAEAFALSGLSLPAPAAPDEPAQDPFTPFIAACPAGASDSGDLSGAGAAEDLQRAPSPGRRSAGGGGPALRYELQHAVHLRRRDPARGGAAACPGAARG